MSFSISKYTRKFGSAEKIKNFVDCYLDSQCKSDNIELLLCSENLQEFTYAAVVDYLQQNSDFYINFGIDTPSFKDISKFCQYYRENKENFFIMKNDVCKTKHNILFKKIKCIWIFYELLKLLKYKIKTENIHLDQVNEIIAQKIESFKSYYDSTNEKLAFRSILGINDIDELLRRDVGSGKKRVTKKRKIQKHKRGKRTRAYTK